MLSVHGRLSSLAMNCVKINLHIQKIILTFVSETKRNNIMAKYITLRNFFAVAAMVGLVALAYHWGPLGILPLGVAVQWALERKW